MSAFDDAIRTIRRVAAEVNTQQLAARTGIPYTTLRGMVLKGFQHQFIENLGKIYDAAVAIERESQEPAAAQAERTAA